MALNMFTWENGAFYGGVQFNGILRDFYRIYPVVPNE